MSGEVKVPYPAGYTTYFVKRNSAGQVAVAATGLFEAWGASGHTADNYDFPLVGDNGDWYIGNFGTGAAGWYWIQAFVQNGLAPADTDDWIGDGVLYWDGAAEVYPAMVGSAMMLAADAITAGTFDESTAYPLKSADSGATAVARVGADADTLETVSDQIDLITSMLPTKDYIAGTDNTDGSIEMDDATGNYAGSVGSVAGAVGSVSGNVTGSVGSVAGNVTGSVGSVAGNVTGSVGSVAGNVTGSVGSVATGVTLADDAITASKFDETTAWPLAAADSGASSVARTGSDADTLETLSDQMDTLALDHVTIVSGIGAVAADVTTLLGYASGSGTIAISVSVTDVVTGFPLDAVQVTVSTDPARANLVAFDTTDTLGSAIVYLDPGTYYFWPWRSGYAFTSPTTVVVAAPATVSFTGAQIMTASAMVLTVEEAKAHLRVTDTLSDGYIENLILAVQAMAATFQGRTYLTTSLVQKFDGSFPESVNLYGPPLASVTTIQYIDSGGTLQTLASSVYDVDTTSEPGRITLAYNQTWPETYGTANDITITYVAGYTDAAAFKAAMPAAYAAILLGVGHLYENRSAVTADGLKEMPLGFKDLLWPNRVMYTDNAGEGYNGSD
jgi:uncharacterized phiE125 gp8 family phage protein